MSTLRQALKWTLILPIRFYSYCISPLLPPSCRHVPTCSDYAQQAIRLHGPGRGSYLALRRVCRCHPWAPGGHDPVPPPGPHGELHHPSHD